VRLRVRGVALMDMGHPKYRHVGHAPLKKRVFVRANPEPKSRLGRDQVSVRDVG